MARTLANTLLNNEIFSDEMVDPATLPDSVRKIVKAAWELIDEVEPDPDVYVAPSAQTISKLGTALLRLDHETDFALYLEDITDEQREDTAISILKRIVKAAEESSRLH